MEQDPTNRFGDRVADYVRARPRYPDGVFALIASLGVRPGATIADVGSGTGIFAGQLIERGYRVIAVEPNEAMRRAAESSLGGSEHFTSVHGRAEATGLPDQSIDLVTAAQAFHWFEPDLAAGEFLRILKPAGLALLVWNITRWVGTPAADELGAIIRRYNRDLGAIDHRRYSTDDARLLAFFAGGSARLERFEHSRELGFDDFVAGVASASYMPSRSDSDFARLESELRALFTRHSDGRKLRLDYETRVAVGRPGGRP